MNTPDRVTWLLALDLMETMADDSPCQRDHLGTCQAHRLGEVNGRCGNLIMNDILDEARPGWDGQ